MTQFVVINSGPTMVEPPIENAATGAKDSVFLQPGGRVTLEEGFSIPQLFLKKNPELKQVDRSAYLAQRNQLETRASYHQQAAAQKVAPAPQPVPAPAPPKKDAEQPSNKSNGKE